MEDAIDAITELNTRQRRANVASTLGRRPNQECQGTSDEEIEAPARPRSVQGLRLPTRGGHHQGSATSILANIKVMAQARSRKHAHTKKGRFESMKKFRDVDIPQKMT